MKSPTQVTLIHKLFPPYFGATRKRTHPPNISKVTEKMSKKYRKDIEKISKTCGQRQCGIKRRGEHVLRHPVPPQPSGLHALARAYYATQRPQPVSATRFCMKYPPPLHNHPPRTKIFEVTFYFAWLNSPQHVSIIFRTRMDN